MSHNYPKSVCHFYSTFWNICWFSKWSQNKGAVKLWKIINFAKTKIDTNLLELTLNQIVYSWFQLLTYLKIWFYVWDTLLILLSKNSNYRKKSQFLKFLNSTIAFLKALFSMTVFAEKWHLKNELVKLDKRN